MPSPASANLAARQDEHACQRPQADALIDGSLRLSHAQLAQRIARSASRLRALGLNAGTLAGVALGDHTEHLVLLLALARIGAVLLPLDHRWTVGERERVARHFGATVVFIEPGQSIPRVANVAVDAAWHAAVDAAPCDTLVAPGGDAPLLVSLSSGTTGRPKGPLITHAHFLARFRTHQINLGFTASERFVCATPLYFGAGRTFAWSTLFFGGATVLAAPPFDPAGLMDTLERERATCLFLVPAQLRRLLEEHAGNAAVRDLRLLFSSGAPLTRDERSAIRTRLNSRFHEYYASTEGGGVTLLEPADIDAHGDSVGRPVHGVELQAVDDAHESLPPDVTGVLRYRGPGCATHFFRDEQASRESFRDGWFYPGDLGRIDATGFLTLTGRAKDMLIRGGINVYPDEIEAVLRAHPQVRDVAVIGFASPVLGEEIAAFVVAPSEAWDETDLRTRCADQLAPYKVPRLFIRVDDLPRNSAGKVLKDTLRASAALQGACRRTGA